MCADGRPARTLLAARCGPGGQCACRQRWPAATQFASSRPAAPSSMAGRRDRQPVLDRGPGRGQLPVEGGDRRGGVEQHRVAHRAALAGQHRAHHLGVERGVAAAQRLAARPARCRASPGRARPAGPSPSATTQTLRGGRGGQLVQAVVAAEHQRASRRGRRAPAAITGAIARSAQPIAAARGRAGLVSGPRKLNDGRHAELAARAGRRAASPGGRPARSRSRCRPRATVAATPSAGRSIATPSSSSTSAAPHGRGRRPVAVLDHRPPAAGDDQRRHRRDVDGVGPVAAGADDVDRAAVDRHRGWRRSQHRARPARPARPAVSPLARSSDGERRPAGPAVASPAMISSIAQRGVVGRQVGAGAAARSAAPARCARVHGVADGRGVSGPTG